MSKTVHFYFDPISPYVYLAWTQLPRLLDQTQAQIKMVPVLFAGLLNAHGQKGPAEIPAKRTYTMHDVYRWSRYYGLEIKGPPGHPFNPLAALRMCLALTNEEEQNAFAGRIIEAPWADGLDISDGGTLKQIAAESKLDAGALWEAAHSAEVKEQLKKNTMEAIGQGVFGVPTFIVDKEMFWGNDRLIFLADYLKGAPPIDPKKAEAILGRARLADRKP